MPTSVETFQRLAAGTKTTPTTPWPPFPRIPDDIRRKFPDLEASWNEYDKAVALWVAQVQISQN